MRTPVVRHAIGASAVRMSADTPPSINSRIDGSNPLSVQTQSSVCSVVVPSASQKSNNIAVLETFDEYRNLKRELERSENKNKAWAVDYKALTRRMQKLAQSTFRTWIFSLSIYVTLSFLSCSSS